MSIIRDATLKSYAGTSAASDRSLQAPTSGIYVPVPGLYETVPLEYLVLDLSEYAGMFVRITAVKEDTLYVFGASNTDTMVGLPDPVLDTGDYKYDMTPLVPDIIGYGTSIRELVPTNFPFLILKAAQTEKSEVRIRRA